MKLTAPRWIAAPMMLAVLSSAVLAQEAPRPVVTVTQIDAPQIDGEIGADEWEGATGVGAFIELGGVLVPGGAACRVASDDRGLVLAWTMSDPPDARRRGRDGDLWRDDAVEVFVEPAGSLQYYQVIVNAAGDIADFEGRDPAWDADVEAAVGSTDDRWWVEMRIPWADLGGQPAPAEAWGVNFARDIAGGTPLTWAQMEGSFHEPAQFGELRVTDGGAVAGVTAVRRSEDHRLLVDTMVRGAELTATLLADDTEIASASAAATRTLALPIAEPGRYLLRMRAAAGEETLFAQEVPLVRHAPIELSLRKGLLEADRAIVNIDASAAEVEPEQYRLTVQEREPVTLDAGADPRHARADVDLSGVGPGEVALRVEALRGGEVIAEATESFELPPTPPWVGSDIGVSDELPEPWTPVRATEDAVACWGREYRFADAPLPAELTTADAQVLADGMRLTTVVGGRHQFWRDAGLRWDRRRPTDARGTITARADTAELRAEVLCEFDGLLHFDLQVRPAAGQALEELVLEIPLRAEHARYLHLADATWGGSVSTALPEEGWEHHFMPLVWLGDEQRGLQWFAESDEGWRPADPEGAITIDRREGVTVLRLHMVEEALPAGETFSTGFGLQATPVKPLDPDHRRWHITHGAFYAMEDQPASAPAYVAYPAEGNISLERGTVEMRVKPLFDPQVEVEPSTRGRFNRSLLRLELDSGDHLGFYWNIDDRCMRLYTRVDGDVRMVLPTDPPQPWRQGQWHQVAFTWGEEATVFIDGQPVASREWQGSLPGTLEKARLFLGSPGRSGPCEFVVDDLRVSDVPRDLAGGPGAQIAPDEHTLLYDGFDDAGAGGADVAATPGRSVHGREHLRWVDGVAGSAVAIGSPDTRLSLLDDLKRRGVNTLVFHQEWTEIQAYGSTEMNRERLHSLVEACHERDIRLLLYFGYELSDAAPEWDTYRGEVLVWPRRGGYERHDIPQTAYRCCYVSAWKEYILTSIARMMDEFDIDGVYLDGTTHPCGCANELHGCGYVGPDGERHRTYPIFAVRDLMRRMRRVVKSRKPDGLISAHMSATVCMPTMSFIDSYWDGEQLDVHQHGFRLPLGAFRAEFMGHNWGVPAEFLCYLNRPFSYEEAVPLALLHDVPVRPYARSELLGMMSRVWDAWDAIDIHRATWYPYWAAGGPVSTESDDALVSTHVGPGGALVVAMNASDQDRTMRLTVDMDAATVRELVHDRELTIEGGTVSLATPAWEGAVLLIE